MPTIPPAYKNVVVYKKKTSKVFATGVDSKGRKQIIYNKWFIQHQQKQRFRKITRLMPVFQKVERYIDDHLNRTPSRAPITKKTEMCILLKLMILCNFRIGNERYLRKYGTYGLTTMLWKFVKFNRSTASVSIKFVGKKNVVNEAVCTHPKLYRIMRRASINAAPSTPVFSLTAADVNAFLKRFDPKLTSKDMRTWRANVLYMKYYDGAPSDARTPRAKQKYALDKVATLLHNTPAVCKTNYIHPRLLV